MTVVLLLESAQSADSSVQTSGIRDAKSILNGGIAAEDVPSFHSADAQDREMPPQISGEGMESSSLEGMLLYDTTSNATTTTTTTTTTGGDKLTKSAQVDMPASPTLVETFSASGEAARAPDSNHSLVIKSTTHMCEDGPVLESRSCAMEDERRDDDDERDEIYPTETSLSFFQTRVEFTEPFLASARVSMIRSQSSESWNCYAAWETSLFDEVDGGESECEDNHSTHLVEGQAEATPFALATNNVQVPLAINDSTSHSDASTGTLCCVQGGPHVENALASARRMYSKWFLTPSL